MMTDNSSPMFPKVSVVMSVLNGEAFLRPAIDSVLAQSFTDLELIVIDNASTDGSAAILDSYADPRLVRLKNDSILTLTQSLNKGLQAARGEYIARLDADDIALPQRIERQVAFLDQNRDILLLGSNWVDLMADGRLVERELPPPHDHPAILQAMATGNVLVHSTLLFRRQPVLELGGYPADFAFAQDYALYLRLIAAGYSLATLTEPLVHLRHHLQQFSMRPETALLRADEEERLLMAAGALPELSGESARRNRRALASIRVRKGLALWRGGHKLAAAVSWAYALSTDPTSCACEGWKRTVGKAF